MSTYEWSAPPLVLSEEELAESLLHLGKQGPRGGMVCEVDGLLCVKIPLTQGKFALVNFEDYEHVGKFRWFAYRDRKTWYARRAITSPKFTIISMQNEIIPSNSLVDHIDLDGLNNRRSNLRIVSANTNAHNTLTRSASGYRGVYEQKIENESHRWCAQIRSNYKLKTIGRYPTPELAARAYDAKAIELYGQNARLNFPA